MTIFFVTSLQAQVVLDLQAIVYHAAEKRHLQPVLSLTTIAESPWALDQKSQLAYDKQSQSRKRDLLNNMVHLTAIVIHWTFLAKQIVQWGAILLRTISLSDKKFHSQLWL